MRSVPTKHQYYMSLATAAAQRSKDPNTQVGAVIVNDDGRIISLGYNGMAESMPEWDCWTDELKDDLVIHAEVNAIANAARSGASTLGSSMYITLTPCLPCTRVVVAAGIKRVFWPESSYYDWIERKPHWEAKFNQSIDFLNRCKVDWRMI